MAMACKMYSPVVTVKIPATTTHRQPPGTVARVALSGMSSRASQGSNGLSTIFQDGYDAFATLDIDRDGLADVLYTRGNSGEYDGLFWLRQERSEKPQAVFTSARDEDSRALPLPDSFMSKVVNWVLR